MTDEQEERPDGFRPRRTRPKGWIEAAIKDGSVRDPNAPEPESPAKQPGDVWVDVPAATMSGKVN